MSKNGNYDLIVLGAGPAGLALAAESQAQGMRVAVVAPAPRMEWVQNWSAFEDEVPDVPVARRWARAEVRLPDRHLLRERPYVQVDGPALQRRLLDRCGTTDLIDGTFVGRTGSTLQTTAGSVAGRFIVDCTGAAQVLGASGPPATAFQTAYGLHVQTNGHPWDPDVATYMDLRGMRGRPTFLYAMPTSTTEVFVEETSLAARPAVAMDELERRLTERLERLDVTVTSVHKVERCRIALDVPPPAGLAFGTAAGMTHPATGYLLARTLAAAPLFARCLARDDPDAAMRSVRSASRRLHLLGLDVLTSCGADELTAFFDAFFSQPGWVTDAFLARDPALPPTIAAMLRIFATSPQQVRRLLVRPLLNASSPETECPVR